MATTAHTTTTTPLIVELCKLGNSKELQEYLTSSEGCDVNQKDARGYLPIHWAALNGHYNIISVLLGYDGDSLDIDGRDSSGGTAVMKAAVKGHTHIVRQLLDHGAYVDAHDNKGVTALHYAAEKGYVECVDALIKRNANLNEVAQPFRWTALHVAAQAGQELCCRSLIEGGIDINCIDINSSTPLMLTCTRGNDNIVTMLLQRGAYLNLRDSNGYHALHYAAKYGWSQCMLAIIESIGEYENSFITVGDRGDYEEANSYSVLHLIAEANTKKGSIPPSEDMQQRYLECARLLIERKGMHVNIKANDDVTPLHIASDIGNALVVECLLQNNANVNSTNIYGDTALHYALQRKHSRIISLLIIHRASLYAESYDGVTPLDIMPIDSIIDIVYNGIYNGDYQQKDYTGCTILHRISEWGRIEWMNKILININKNDVIDLLFKSSVNEMSPFVVAIRSRNDEMASDMIKTYFKNRYRSAIEICESESYFDKNILHLMVEMKCYKSLISVMDLLVLEAGENKITLLPDLLNINEYGHRPPLYDYSASNPNYTLSSPSLYQKLYYTNYNPVIFHPIITILTNRKIYVYSRLYYLYTLLFIAYLLLIYLMLFSLSYNNDNRSGGIIILMLVLIIAIIADATIEIAEFIGILYRYFKRIPTLEYLESMQTGARHLDMGTDNKDVQLHTYIDAMEKSRKLLWVTKIRNYIHKLKNVRLQGAWCLTKYLLNHYFLEITTLLDISGIFFLVCYLLANWSNSPDQWVLASISFIINTLRIFKYSKYLLYIGPHSYSTYNALIYEFPKFVIIFFILLITFTGGLTFSLISTDSGCYNHTGYLAFCNASQTFLSGIRVLLQGHILENNADFFTVLGFYPTVLYISFLIFTVIFLINILIAQLTQTYALTLLSKQKYKYKIAVEFESKSFVYLILGRYIQLFTAVIKARVSKDYWNNILIADTLLKTRSTEELLYELKLELLQKIDQKQINNNNNNNNNNNSNNINKTNSFDSVSGSNTATEDILTSDIL